ncbi:MAG: HAMP domain-containing sensor histidine kinase [Actinomycetota bacterium]
MWRARSGGRSLRRRIALAVGLLTSLSVIVFGVTSWLLVANSLASAVDDDLRQVVGAIQRVGSVPSPADFTDGTDPRADDGVDFDELFPDGDRPSLPYFEVFRSDGTLLFGELPVTDTSQAVSRGEQDEAFETVRLDDDRTVRLLTVAVDDVPQIGAVRIGLDTTNITDGLRQARFATAVAAVIAGLLAALLAWLSAGRLIAPVTAVADAAEHLRRDDDLPERLEGEGDDELGRLISSFNALLDDLRRSRKQQRRLVADASHELRTQLTSLRVKTEFIQTSPSLPADERQRLLDGAVTDIGALTELVNELVALASDGANPERSRLVDLAEVVEASVEQFRLTSGRTVELHTSPGMVETQPRQVARAVTNLLGNANKYAPEGPIVVTQNGPRIEVRDHGPGIDVDDRDRVFDRFYRGRAHQSIEGSGRGLAIVESVAKSNGGRSWVTDPGDGGPGVVVGFSAGPG